MKRIINCLSLFALLAMPLLFTSCEKNIEEGDDFIAGKWRNLEVLENEELDNYHYRDYIEYAPYNYDPNKRTAITYTFDDDSTFYYSVGHYSISGDTLTYEDNMERTFIYFIQSIKKDTLIYTDSKGKIYRYLRYKGTEYIPPTPSEDEEEGGEEE